MKKQSISGLLLIVLAAAIPSWAQSQDVQVLHLRGPIFMISAGGSNITASIGPDGVLLADTGPEALADKVKTAIQDVQKQLQLAQMR